MNSDKASGVLHSTLERLALHFDMIDIGKLGSINRDKAFGQGVEAAIEIRQRVCCRRSGRGETDAGQAFGGDGMAFQQVCLVRVA